MHIAVIGATGMIGHNTLLAARAAGHDLTVLHRPSSDISRLQQAGVSFKVADLADPGALATALEGVDGVINCAAPYPTLPVSWRQEEARALSVMADFYRACEEAKVGRIVYLGGSIALKRRNDGVPATEADVQTSRPPGTNPYVQAKWAMDQQAMEKAAEGLPVMTGIPTMTFGEYDWGPTTGQIILGIATGTLAGIVDGNRNTIYAGDAGRGLVRVLEAGKPGNRYLLTGENTTMADVAAKVAERMGVSMPKIIPLPVAKLVSAAQHMKYRFGGPPPQLSKTAIAVLSGGQFLDGSKARKDLGFEPAVGLDEAIDRTLAWFRSVDYLKT